MVMRRHHRSFLHHNDLLASAPLLRRVNNRPMIHLQITTGRGPAECCVALHHVVTRILAEGPGAQCARATPYSSVITLEGDGASDYARQWVGTILWVCEDPLSPNRGRKNWYVGVQEVELPEPVNITLREQDLKWE